MNLLQATGFTQFDDIRVFEPGVAIIEEEGQHFVPFVDRGRDLCLFAIDLIQYFFEKFFVRKYCNLFLMLNGLRMSSIKIVILVNIIE